MKLKLKLPLYFLWYLIFLKFVIEYKMFFSGMKLSFSEFTYVESLLVTAGELPRWFEKIISGERPSDATEVSVLLDARAHN